MKLLERMSKELHEQVSKNGQPNGTADGRRANGHHLANERFAAPGAKHKEIKDHLVLMGVMVRLTSLWKMCDSSFDRRSVRLEPSLLYTQEDDAVS